MWVLPTGHSSSRTPLARVLFMGYSPSGGHCSSTGPSQAPVPARPPAPAWALLRLQPPSGHIHLLLQCSPLWAAEGQAASPGSSPWAAGKSWPWHLGNIPILILLLHWCLQSCFSSIFSLLSLTAAAQQFHPFLNNNDRGSVSFTDGFIFAQRRVCF